MRASILPRPGDVLGGKYRIERKIGSGGMGSVYQAVDQTLGRYVAIKVLDPKMSADPLLHARFEREARMARHLQHPNTIQIFDYGRSPNGIPYIVMEYLRGRTLDEIIRTDGAISMARTMAFSRQILQSLAEAHAAGVIHRDLKPHNVIVGEFGGQKDFVKVLDFGIAKLLDAERDAGALKTRSGMVIGSPAYMAPERIKSEDLSPASDIYSLGVMMIEMLSGRMLFEERTPVEVIADRLGGLPLPVPDWVRVSPVGRMLDRATAWDARERYQSALEMIEAIDRIVRGDASASTLTPTKDPQAWGYSDINETLKMASDGMDLSKPRGSPDEPSLWSNPANVIMVVLIAVLLIATVVILLVALS